MCARYQFVECIKWTFSARLLFRFFCNLYFVDTQSFRSVRPTEYKLYFFTMQTYKELIRFLNDVFL